MKAVTRYNLSTPEGLRTAPDWLLRYFAPMACGGREREELCRRFREQLLRSQPRTPHATAAAEHP